MTRREMEEMILAALDGELDRERWPDFERRLLEDNGFRQLYREQARLHSALEAWMPAEVARPGVVPVDRIVKMEQRRWLKHSMAAAVLLLLVAASVMWRQLTGGPDFHLEASPGARYRLESASTGGSGLRRLVVDQGSIRLRLEGKVEGIVRGPADLEFGEGLPVVLHEGRARFEVGPGGEGFTVRAGALEVEDLGTAFGVAARTDGRPEVHVFEGRVRISRSTSPMAGEELHKGEARRLGEDGSFETIPLRSAAFPQEFPVPPRHFVLSFDDASSGAFVAEELGGGGGFEARPQGGEGAWALVPGIEGKALELRRGWVDSDWQGVTGSGPRSVAFWLKIPRGSMKGTPPAIVGWGGLSSERNEKWKVWATTMYGRRPRPCISLGAENFVADVEIDDDAWHHWVAIFPGEGAGDRREAEPRIYLDGKALPLTRHARGTGGRPLVRTLGEDEGGLPMRIGYGMEENVRLFTGVIDELHISDSVFSPRTIDDLSRRR